MIRIIIRRDRAHMAAHVGGAVLTTYRTIDYDLHDLEEILRSGGTSEDAFDQTQVVGVEIVAEIEAA